MNSLTDKIAIVTGASSGIGYATSKLFAREGAKIVVTARNPEKLNELVNEISLAGGTAVAIVGDVKDESSAKSLVETALDHFGGLDIAFNNAGTMKWVGDTRKVNLAEWQDTLNTNLTSAFLGAKHQLPAMLARGSGSLIFTSSFVGYTAGFPHTAAYAASKAGIIGLTQALASEFGPRGIRVNALLPGATDTPMGRSFANTPEMVAFVKSLYALKRMASPEEIAKSALYLASDASSFTTGSALVVDGGVSINHT
ncbi:MAG: SDR family oxidoreductase [Gammaproteobacteria bacterium]|nr:SDR family oxidoreductase [Gammaproteobacteria bacterium]MDH5800105.1 SDR family oxidoreductase [Gammaproteobacteria bacterium]